MKKAAIVLVSAVLLTGCASPIAAKLESRPIVVDLKADPKRRTQGQLDEDMAECRDMAEQAGIRMTAFATLADSPSFFVRKCLASRGYRVLS